MLDAHQQPHQFPRRLLVAVTGLSPQIVTETLYALAVAPPASAFVPTEIHLITTRSGAEKASPLGCDSRQQHAQPTPTTVHRHP